MKPHSNSERRIPTCEATSDEPGTSRTGEIALSPLLRLAASYVLLPMAVCGLLASTFPPPASAQQYSLDRSTVDGGGGTSTGGVYSVTGTIGQAGAGLALSGGPFTLADGFWSMIAVAQTPDVPVFTVALPPDLAVVVS